MNIILYLLFLVSLSILFWQISNFISVFFGSPYVKSNKKMIHEVLKLAHLQDGEIFYDLGCGNGDSLIQAAKFGAKATGFEISPYYYFWAKLRTFYRPNIKIKYQNINNVNLEKVDVVYCYLLPKLLDRLKNKFLKDRPKKIISIGFKITGLPLQKLYKIKKHKIFIYSLSSRSV